MDESRAAAKVCRGCGELKPLGDFHRLSKSPDGRRPRCKSCRVDESRQNYTKNGERIRQAVRRWAAENPNRAAANRRRYTKSPKGRETRKAWEERYGKRASDRALYARNPDPYKARSRKRQALKRGVDAELIDPVDVFERDRWTCLLCGSEIDSSLKYPHPQSASVDHVIPLSLGGEHSMANVQASHLLCNRRKGARG